jgi:hypothetical protein
MKTLHQAVGEANSFRSAMGRLNAGADVVSLFALHHHWVGRESLKLAAAFQEVDGPLGVMFWHADDPFSRTEALEGALELIRSRGDIGVLRSDIAALGLQAHGAVLGSIGVGTGTRHYTRPEARPAADLHDRSPRVLVPPLLSYWRGSRIEVVGEDPLFACPCSVCDGKSLGRFADPSLKMEAAEHSVESWSCLAEELRQTPPSRREPWWSAKVTAALRHIVELEDRLYLPQPPSKQLSSWCEVIGVAVP